MIFFPFIFFQKRPNEIASSHKEIAETFKLQHVGFRENTLVYFVLRVIFDDFLGQ